MDHDQEKSVSVIFSQHLGKLMTESDILFFFYPFAVLMLSQILVVIK